MHSQAAGGSHVTLRAVPTGWQLSAMYSIKHSNVQTAFIQIVTEPPMPCGLVTKLAQYPSTALDRRCSCCSSMHSTASKRNTMQQASAL